MYGGTSLSKKIRIIGYDLNYEYCQISYSGASDEEPETLYLLDEKEGTELPLIIAKRTDETEWVTGTEARRIDAMQTGIVVRDLLRGGLAKKRIEDGGETISVVSLLTTFIEQSMQRIYLPEMDDYETYLVFTIPEISEDAITLLKSIASRLGFSRKNVFVQDYKESFYDYIIRQQRELWNYEVALFGFEELTMYAYRLQKMPFVKSRRNRLFSVEQKNYGGIACRIEDDAKFLEYVREFFGKSLISSVFLIGKEFEKDWYAGTLKLLCNGRRVFRGRNLFSKGACYGGFRKCGEIRTDTVYLDPYKIKYQVSLRLKVNGKEQWYPLACQGENWYEINRSIEILVDQATELKVRVDTIGDNMPRQESILLEGLFETQRRTIRLHIEAVFLSRNRCRIRIHDVDFGEIRKATGYDLVYMLQL